MTTFCPPVPTGDQRAQYKGLSDVTVVCLPLRITTQAQETVKIELLIPHLTSNIYAPRTFLSLNQQTLIVYPLCAFDT